MLSLTRDTTEADLKQRREIGSGGTVYHVDQGVVKAALAGRVLVLEGTSRPDGRLAGILRAELAPPRPPIQIPHHDGDV